MLRRYRLRLIDQGHEHLADRPHVEALDLDTGPGLAHANALLAGRLISMCHAAGLKPRDVDRCHLRVEDEHTGVAAHTVYPPADTL